jgi:DNA-binding NarL/FixJ family response regulator
MVRDLIRELHRAAAIRVGELTPREADVLDLLRRGYSTGEIARGLAISPVTVRRHTSDLVRKIGVEDRAALLRSEVVIRSPHVK